MTGLAARFAELEPRLNALDAATGDGDHGTTMRRGLEAVVAAEDEPVAKAFRTAAGGASGSLFGAVLGAMEAVLAGDQDLAPALSGATERISRLGMAKAGDKTMLDALIPAAEAAREADGAKAPRAAAEAAQAGSEATAAMAAKRGRTRYVEGAGTGHIDAGAVSVAEILSHYAEHMETQR